MAEKKKTTDGQQPQEAPKETPQSARDRYRSRYSAAHPDMNLDDEEAFYTQANANLDELEGYREDNRVISEAFEKTPLLAGLVVAAKQGENPFTYLAENVGPDMDIRELATDEEFGKKMGEALAKYQERQAASAKAAEEIGTNMQQSFAALKELQQERGMSDEEAVALVKKMFGDVDDNGEVTDEGIFGRASKGMVSKEVWQAILKAENYDADIASATDRARASALNERIQNPKREMGGPGIPSMPTGGTPRSEKPKKNDNSLEAFRKSLGV